MMQYSIITTGSRSALLDKGMPVQPVWNGTGQSTVTLLLPKFAVATLEPRVRYLTRQDQRVFERALRRSVRVIA